MVQGGGGCGSSAQHVHASVSGCCFAGRLQAVLWHTKPLKCNVHDSTYNSSHGSSGSSKQQQCNSSSSRSCIWV